MNVDEIYIAARELEHKLFVKIAEMLTDFKQTTGAQVTNMQVSIGGYENFSLESVVIDTNKV